ncbi:MAG: hypothetical protein ACOVOT_11490 [Rubrivivax sp.]|jgi:hypothetical protein
MMKGPRDAIATSVRAAMLAWMLASVLALSACTTPPLVPGQSSRADAVRIHGAPTDRYGLDGGAERLEFATGPYGRTTWMVDVDAQGRVLRAAQVLNEASFLEVQEAIARGPLTPEALLRMIGRPGERFGARTGQIWNWRYPTHDCLWFQATIAHDGSAVRDAGYGIDRRCDAPNDHR